MDAAAAVPGNGYLLLGIEQPLLRRPPRAAAYNGVSGCRPQAGQPRSSSQPGIRAFGLGPYRNCVGRSGDRPTPLRDQERTDSHVSAGSPRATKTYRKAARGAAVSHRVAGSCPKSCAAQAGPGPAADEQGPRPGPADTAGTRGTNLSGRHLAAIHWDRMPELRIIKAKANAVTTSGGVDLPLKYPRIRWRSAHRVRSGHEARSGWLTRHDHRVLLSGTAHDMPPVIARPPRTTP